MPRAGVQTREAWEDRPRLSREREERFFAGAEEATRFFMGEADVRRALEKIARLLEEDGILDLPSDLAGELDPFVRNKYRELWQAAQTEERE